MDGSAIKELERMACLGLSNKQLKSNGVDAVVVYSGCQISDLEHYREHMRYQRGVFKTHYIEAFSEYVVGNHNNTRPRIFINDTSWSATAFMDFGTTEKPGHRKHKAVLNLQQTAEYSALRTFVEAAHSTKTQREFSEFLSDWRHCIKCYETEDSEEPLDIKSSIIAIKNMKLSHTTESNSLIGNFSVEQSGMEKLDAQSRTGVVPGLFVFKAVPYHGLSEFDFTVRVVIPLTPGVDKDAKPRFSFQFVRHADLVEDMAIEFSSRVEKEFSSLDESDLSKPLVTVGTFD